MTNPERRIGSWDTEAIAAAVAETLSAVRARIMLQEPEQVGADVPTWRMPYRAGRRDGLNAALISVGDIDEEALVRRIIDGPEEVWLVTPPRSAPDQQVMATFDNPDALKRWLDQMEGDLAVWRRANGEIVRVHRGTLEPLPPEQS